MAVAAVATVVVGFAPSFSRPATSPAMTSRVVVHATLFSTFIVLFVVQTLLVATGHTRLHRRLGVAAAALAAILVVITPPVVLGLARRGLPAPDPFLFMCILLVELLGFAVFVGGGIYYRHRPETHKRLMLLGITSMLGPGVSRWPIAAANPGPVVFTVVLVFVAAAPILDVVMGRRINRVSLWGGLALLASGPLRFVVGQSAVWHQLARWMVG
jgi:hypothetical protein